MLRYRIANMTCGGCAKGVTATLREADATARPAFDLDRREVAIATTLPAATVRAALVAAGWEAEAL
jgi:copper chaperone